MAASRKAISRLPGAEIGIAPHSLRAVTPDELAAIIPLADGGPVHIHAAEQVKEVEDCLAWSGRRPVQWLLENAPVDQRWCLIHATHTTDAEVTAFARTGAVAGLAHHGSQSRGRHLSGARIVHAGGAFGVGTDSNVLVGAADELRQLEYGQRLKHRERNVLSGGAGRSTGRTLFDHTLAGGARALAQATVRPRARRTRRHRHT
ncbi:amidohydrolase family protein [Bradyrhizobium japonicum]